MDWPTAGIIITVIFAGLGLALKYIPSRTPKEHQLAGDLAANRALLKIIDETTISIKILTAEMHKLTAERQGLADPLLFQRLSQIETVLQAIAEIIEANNDNSARRG